VSTNGSAIGRDALVTVITDPTLGAALRGPEARAQDAASSVCHPLRPGASVRAMRTAWRVLSGTILSVLALSWLGCATPGDRDVTIRAGDAGQVVTVAVGRPFRVVLETSASPGPRWEPRDLPAFLFRTDAFVGPLEGELGPGIGARREVLLFEARLAGSGELVLEQRSPWSPNDPPIGTFAVTIEAK
jgi:hypothetical protein